MTKVLVFEKDEEKATQLQQAFKEKGILCKIASTPKEVLRLLREDSRKILVLNYEQGGDDIAGYLASKDGNTPFYFISERIERKYKIDTNTKLDVTYAEVESYLETHLTCEICGKTVEEAVK